MTVGPPIPQHKLIVEILAEMVRTNPVEHKHSGRYLEYLPRDYVMGHLVRIRESVDSWARTECDRYKALNALHIASLLDVRKLAEDLREAQKIYLADRGNDSKGRMVGESAARLDIALKASRELIP